MTAGNGLAHWIVDNGAVGINQKRRAAYRVVWEALVGPIPKGLVIDHLCRNKACVMLRARKRRKEGKT